MGNLIDDLLAFSRICAEIDRVRSFGVGELRALWRTTFRSSPPPAFTKDLIARLLCWHIQEQALGGKSWLSSQWHRTRNPGPGYHKWAASETRSVRVKVTDQKPAQIGNRFARAAC
jgi:Protein of unknown function (DUF2924)